MNCKNCDTPIIANSKYCHQCGQKNSTTRLTPKRFISQHVIKKYLYFDQNFTNTIWDILTKPGVVAWNYINGRRRLYFGLISLLGIIITAYLFIDKSNPFIYNDSTEISKFVDFLESNNDKLFIFNLPILGLLSWLVFRRLKLNLVEHAVAALVAVIGGSLFSLLGNLVYILGLHLYTKLIHFPWPIRLLSELLDLATLLFVVFTFIQFTGKHYTLLGKVWRILLVFVLAAIIWVIIFLITILIYTRGDLSSLQG